MMLGMSGILLSLPLVHQATSLIPGTFLRSPARLIYLTEFALAVALGMGVHTAFGAMRPRIGRVVLPLLLIIHMVDLVDHDRRFIIHGSLGMTPAQSETITGILKQVGDGRVAIDYELALPMDRTVDDVGFFDSIMLARPYRAVLSLSGAPRDLNTQTFNGSDISLRALAAAAVKFVITTVERADLSSEGQLQGIRIYRVPSPFRRAEFFEANQIQYLPADQIHAMLRDPKIDLRSRLLLPRGAPFAQSKIVSGMSTTESPIVEYRRPDSDNIECTVTTGRNGYLRIIESWDPGWSATVDGLPVPVVPAMDALLAVPIASGKHEVRFIYRTPGALAGQAISIISLTLLGILMWIAPHTRHHF